MLSSNVSNPVNSPAYISTYQNKLNEVFQNDEIKSQFIHKMSLLFDQKITNDLKDLYEGYIGKDRFFKKLNKYSRENPSIANQVANFFADNIDQVRKQALSELLFQDVKILTKILEFVPYNSKLALVSKLFNISIKETSNHPRHTRVVHLENFPLRSTDQAIEFVVQNKISHPDFMGFSLKEHHLKGLEGSNLKSFAFDSPWIETLGFKHLTKFSLDSLKVSGYRDEDGKCLSTEDLELIAKHPLKSLTLERCNLKDDDLEPLKGLPLTHLDLMDNDITTIGLKIISNMLNLTSLNITLNNIPSESLVDLRQMPLKTLKIKIHDPNDLKYVQKEHLTELELVIIPKTDHFDFQLLQRYSKLTNLTVNSSYSFSSISFNSLSYLPLTRLILTGLWIKRIPSQILQSIKSKRLTHLSLYQANLQNESLMFAQKMPLEDLNICYNPISDAGLTLLKNRPLRRLNLAGCKGITGSNFHLFERMPLTSLNLRNTSIKDEVLGVLGNQMSLTHLVLSGTSVTDVGLSKLKNLQLKELMLHYCPITGSGFKDFNHSTLMTVGIGGTNISDTELAYLQNQPLTSLYLFECPNITGLGFAHFLNVPLRELWLEPNSALWQTALQYFPQETLKCV